MLALSVQAVVVCMQCNCAEDLHFSAFHYYLCACTGMEGKISDFAMPHCDKTATAQLGMYIYIIITPMATSGETCRRRSLQSDGGVD